jgi:hypothetical protein
LLPPVNKVPTAVNAVSPLIYGAYLVGAAGLEPATR